MTPTTQKKEVSHLVTFTEEILNGKLHFCVVTIHEGTRVTKFFVHLSSFSSRHIDIYCSITQGFWRQFLIVLTLFQAGWRFCSPSLLSDHKSFSAKTVTWEPKKNHLLEKSLMENFHFLCSVRCI